MSNAFLAQQRAPLFAELQQKPWLMNWLASIGESENSGKPLGILEAMFNRAIQQRQSLEQAARSSFWGARTVQRLQSDIKGGSLSPKAVANAKDALDQIKAGSNVTQGATDQGMINEIHSPFKINVDGEYFGDMDNGAFRAKQQAAAAQAGPATGTQVATTAATPPAPTPTAPAPAQTAPNAPESPSSVPRTGVGGLGVGSQGRGGINIPGAPGYSPQLANVTPALREMLAGAKAEFEARNPGYTIAATSGARPGGPSSSQHATGNAIDMQIIGPNGQALANSGDDPTGLYHQYARLVYAEQQANHPELNGKLAWGGAFGTQLGGGGAPDLMHFDLGGERGHWTMNRPSQMGPLALQLAGATNVADQADQTKQGDQPKQGPAYGPPIPPGTTVQNGQLYRAVPSGTGDAYQPGRQAGKGGKGGGMGSTAQSQGQGGLYIPILSDIAGMFAGNYPGRPGLKGGYMQPSATAQPGAAAQPYQPGAPVPAGPAVTWDPQQKQFVPKTQAPPSAPPTPTVQPPGPVTQPPQGAENIPPYNIDPDASRNQPVPAQAASRPNMPLPAPGGPLSITDYLNPQNSTRPPPPPSAPPAPAAMPGETAPPVTQAPGGAQSIPPYNMPPDASRNAPVPGAPAAPATPVASGGSRSAAAPGILQRLGIITAANAGELPPGPSAAGAVAQVQGGTPADFAGRFAGTPTDQRWMGNINTASGRGLGPGQLAPWPGSQPGGGLPSLPSLVGGPAGGTTTVAGIPLPNPRPQMPSGPPVQMAGSGIPLPRPRPQMPAVPPQQIPQPQAPVPAQAPPAAPPPLPQNLGGTQMPAGARPGVRMLDAVPPDYRAGPPQAASFAERFANAPGQPGVPPNANPGMAAALANLAARGPQMTSQGGPVPPAGPEQPPSLAQMNADAMARTPQPASFAARFAGAPVPAQFGALSAFTPGNRGASIVPSQATPANQDDINAAILDYLRRQQQQQQPPTQTYSSYGDYGSGPDYASASG